MRGSPILLVALFVGLGRGLRFLRVLAFVAFHGFLDFFIRKLGGMFRLQDVGFDFVGIVGVLHL